jgi:chemotaxis protein MotB
MDDNNPDLDTPIRKKLALPPTEEGGELWLVSYADLMTLVACFFILMVAFANFEPQTFAEKSKEISKHFNKDKDQGSLSRLEKLQEEMAMHPELKAATKITVNDDNMVISFSGSALFDPGSVELRPEIIPVLDSMIDIIKTKDANYRILAEGHTDSSPTPLNSPLKNNWALSGARAATVIERFERFGFIPTNMVSIGLADTQPLISDVDEKGNLIKENMRMNRRVVIKVLQPVHKDKEMKLGLGVYFQRPASTNTQPVPSAPPGNN